MSGVGPAVLERATASAAWVGKHENLPAAHVSTPMRGRRGPEYGLVRVMPGTF
jgi:hypothetical protein